MKGWPSCLPTMRTVVGPGLLAGMSVCQASLFLVRLSGWPFRLADSRMDAVVVLTLAGLPGCPCPSTSHVNMLPCRSMAVILLPVLAACIYRLFPSSARMGASPGCQDHTWPSVSVITAWLSLAVIELVFMFAGRLTAVGLVVLSAR